jgi:prephenate dehydrogenase
MWADIMRMNENEIRPILAHFQYQLNLLEENLKKGKWSFWHAFFEKARAAREKLG